MVKAGYLVSTLCICYLLHLLTFEINFADLTEQDLERDLDLGGSDAEAWSVTVNKRTLKNMSAKEIKRQDTIWGKTGQGFLFKFK